MTPKIISQRVRRVLGESSQSSQELLSVEQRSPDFAPPEPYKDDPDRPKNLRDCWTPAGSVSLQASGIIVAHAFRHARSHLQSDCHRFPLA